MKPETSVVGWYSAQGERHATRTSAHPSGYVHAICDRIVRLDEHAWPVPECTVCARRVDHG